MTAQQILSHDNASSAQSRVVITWEWFAYLALFAFALALRLASLHGVPLHLSETHNALAAFRAVSPEAPGSPLVSGSPLLFLMQAISFTTFGSSEFAARVLLAAAGALLVLSPLVFRTRIGASTSFIFAALLAFSPILLTASRFSSPVILTAALAMLVVYFANRLNESRHTGAGLALVVAFTALIFLSEAGGPVTAVILVISALLTSIWDRRVEARFSFEDGPETDPPSSIFRQIPLGTALATGALVVFLGATAFLLNPSGLSATGEVLAGALRGFVQRTAEHPAAYPLLISLYYEPFLWILGIAGAVVLLRQDDMNRADRFACVVLLVGAVFAALFSGGEAAHALWVVLPLTYLTARLVQRLVQVNASSPYEWSIPGYARWLVGAGGVALLIVFSLAFQGLARDISFAIEGQLSTIPLDTSNLILLLVTLLFALVSVFLVASMWSARTLLRGVGIALLTFGVITSFGSGWRASVSNAESPFEFWHLQASDADTALLTESLNQLAERESRGFTLMPLTIVGADDGVLAWLTRDFSRAQFVTDATAARGEPVVLIDSNIVPDLGGPYVGQDFTLYRTWPVAALRLTDLPLWWTQGRVGPAAAAAEGVWTTYLWLRQDVWQGSQESAT